MTFKVYKLTPVGSWFFRDGRPYNQKETGLSDIKSLFPPFAITAVGAMRASFARSMGWNGKGDWPSDIKDKLGDHQKLAPLSFRGPYLVREKEGESETLVPAPLNLLGKESESDKSKWEELCRLSPGEKVDCDIGDGVRLPSSKDAQGKKSLFGSYLTFKDLEVVLSGGDLSKISPVKAKDLWDFEFLVGIERGFKTRTALEGLLYSISRVRLEQGISLAVEVDGLEAGMGLQSTLPFGGEGGLAYADKMNGTIKIPDAPELKPSSDGNIRFTVTHLTPAHFKYNWPGPGEEVPGITGSRVVSACLERPFWIGGWDSVSREPLPLKPFLPGGSTWFCEADRDCAEKIRKLGGKKIGEYCEFGFGEIAIGSLNDEQ